jgi:hypothetical protein
VDTDFRDKHAKSLDTINPYTALRAIRDDLSV